MVYYNQYVTISSFNAKIITGIPIGYAWGAIQPAPGEPVMSTVTSLTSQRVLDATMAIVQAHIPVLVNSTIKLSIITDDDIPVI